jgi:hypothetical protein
LGGAPSSLALSTDLYPTTSAATINNFPAIEIGRRGVLNFDVNPSTNYILNAAGPVVVGPGGKLTIGTQGAPMPSSSSATIKFTMSVAGIYGIHVRTNGTFITYGSPKTVSAILGATGASGSTTLKTTTETNWLAGDNIGIAPGTSSFTLYDFGTMSTNAVGLTLSLVSGIRSPRPIWPGTKVEVELINLTRNVKILGASTSVHALNRSSGRNSVSCNFTEFRNSVWGQGHTPGSVVVEATGGSFSIVGCSIWGTPAQNAFAGSTNYTATRFYPFYWKDTVLFNLNGMMAHPPLYSINPNNTNLFFMDNVWGIGATSYWVLTNHSVYNLSPYFRMNNCRWIGSVLGGVILGNGNRHGFPITINNTVFKCNLIGFGLGAGSGALSGTNLHDISNNITYFNSQSGYRQQGGSLASSVGWIFGRFEAFSNFYNMELSSFCEKITFLGATLSGGPPPRSARAIVLNQSSTGTIMENFNISGHTVADILVNTQNAGVSLELRNSTFGTGSNPTFYGITGANGPISTQLQYIDTVSIKSSRHNQTDGNYFEFTSLGVSSSDNVIFRTSPSSLRLRPLNSNTKFESPPVLVPVKKNQTLTIGVWIRLSSNSDAPISAYIGTVPRLICKSNSATSVGTTDTIIATYPNTLIGVWQYISGETPVALDNTAFEIIIDCDGTQGWINVDDMYVSSQNSTKGFKYWVDGNPVPSSTTQNGASVIIL